jgi:flagellar hook-associated protein 1 FlgK
VVMTVGTWTTGETLTMDIDGTSVSVVTTAVGAYTGDEDGVADKFVQAINDAGLSGINVAASGATFTITKVPSTSLSETATNQLTVTTFDASEVLSVDLDGIAVSVTNGATGDVNGTALMLRDAINAKMTGTTASVVDGTITLSKAGSTTLTQAAGAANEVVMTVGTWTTGETLTMDIDGTSVSVVTTAVGAYTGDEDGVADKFVQAINDAGLSGINVAASGATFAITKDPTPSLISAAPNTLTVATFDASEKLSVTLDGTEVSVTNGATGDVNGTALMLRDAINAKMTGTTASVSGSVITLSKAATTFFSFDAAVDPMTGGLVERVFDNGGTQITLSYNLDNRIDGISRNVDGTLVHAPSSGFATQLTMSDATVFSADVAASELENGPADGAVVARITAEHLRADAPVPSLEGAEFSFADSPPIGASARFELAGAEYTLTRVDAGNTARLTPLDFKVTGPEDGRIVPHLTETVTGTVTSYSLSLTVAGGHLSGMGPKPVSDAAVFGLGDTASKASVQGRSVDVTSLDINTDYTISVDFNGVSKTITFERDGNELTEKANGASSLISVAIGEGSSPLVTLTSLEAGSASIHITPSADAALLGFKVAAAELSVEGGKLLARSTNDLALDIKAGGTSAAGSYLHLTDIPDEELIVVLGDEGAKRLSATYEIGAPLADADREPESFRVEMMDEATGRVELFDMATGASIATRFSNGFSRFNVSGQSVELSGFAETGDNFELVTGQRSPGDSRNMDELLSFGQQKTGSRSFQDNFRAIAAGVGATLEAARLTLNSTEAVRDAAVASESELSGVNLDEEAAKLISQQQAYQAAARILQTALEMFETLIRIA